METVNQNGRFTLFSIKFLSIYSILYVFGASLALDEDSPYTNSSFVYIRSAAFIIVVTQKIVLQQSKNVTARKPYRPLLVFNFP